MCCFWLCEARKACRIAKDIRLWREIGHQTRTDIAIDAKLKSKASTAQQLYSKAPVRASSALHTASKYLQCLHKSVQVNPGPPPLSVDPVSRDLEVSSTSKALLRCRANLRQISYPERSCESMTWLLSFKRNTSR